MKATYDLLASAFRHDQSAMRCVDALLHGGPRPVDPRLAACERERASDPETWAAAVRRWEEATYGS